MHTLNQEERCLVAVLPQILQAKQFWKEQEHEVRAQSSTDGWEGTGWGPGPICVDCTIAKVHLSLNWTHSNVVCLHKGGPSKYFDVKILYNETFEPKVCVVAGEGCSDLSDHLKLRRAISLLDRLGTGYYWTSEVFCSTMTYHVSSCAAVSGDTDNTVAMKDIHVRRLMGLKTVGHNV